MIKRFLLGVFALVLVSNLSANAQEKKSGVEKAATKAGAAVGKAADAVGKKTAEVAVKGASKVSDKIYEGKMAPDGTDVYIDGKNKKYYVDKKGAKIYLKAAQIKNRPAGTR